MDSFDPDSDKTSGYHLFFMPSGTVADELSAIIRELAQEYGAPVFEPHVTVLARIPEAEESELIGKTEAFAARLKPLTLTLGEIRSEDAYFRALYAQMIEQDALKELHAEASDSFGMKPDSLYLGHLSFLYGNYPEERKAQSKKKLSFTEGLTFLADELHLFKTPGRTETWQKVLSVPLGR